MPRSIHFTGQRRGRFKLVHSFMDRHPNTARVPRHVEVKNAPPVMCNDKEAVKNAEGQRRHCEEIHCRNRLTMVAQKGRPPLYLLGISRRSSHPSRYSSLRNIETEHLHLSMNTRRTPRRVFSNHAEDEFAQFSADALPSHMGPTPRYPLPIQPEARTMPTNHGFWLDQDQCLLPSRP